MGQLPVVRLRASDGRVLYSRRTQFAAPLYCLPHATNANAVCYSMASLAMHWRAGDTGPARPPGALLSQGAPPPANAPIKVGTSVIGPLSPPLPSRRLERKPPPPGRPAHQLSSIQVNRIQPISTELNSTQRNKTTFRSNVRSRHIYQRGQRSKFRIDRCRDLKNEAD